MQSKFSCNVRLSFFLTGRSMTLDPRDPNYVGDFPPQDPDEVPEEEESPEYPDEF